VTIIDGPSNGQQALIHVKELSGICAVNSHSKMEWMIWRLPKAQGRLWSGRWGGDKLYRPTNLSDLSFSTTADLQPIDGLVGQTRALEAIRFGTKVERAGFNLFVIGPNGARMQDAG
jgi:hypothetical protein